MTDTYTVRATRWARGWELTIDDHTGQEIGVTQSHGLNDADTMIRDLVHRRAGVAPADVVYHLEVDLGVTEMNALLREARAQVKAAEAAQREAAVVSRRAAAQLSAAGLRGTDIAVAMQVSKQRVSQLLRQG